MYNHIPKKSIVQHSIFHNLDDMTNKDENTTEITQATIKQTTNKDLIPEVTTQK